MNRKKQETTLGSPEQEIRIATDITQLELFQEFKRAFSETTGLPLYFFKAGARPPAGEEESCANHFCQMLASGNDPCAACLLCQKKLIATVGASPVTRTCFAGLNESCVPVRNGEKTFGYLLTGQVASSRPTAARFSEMVRQLHDLGLEFDEAALRRAYFATRVVSQTQYRSIVDLLSIFAGHLSLVAGQLALQANHSDSPNITKAREFIAEHLTEPLDLKTVANRAHLSSCYFCKRFRDETGLTFTEYVARARVEAAKNMLVNPQIRVSEVAFEVGFQSLSHFNRVFKDIAGQSPSVYRDGLPCNGAKSAGHHAPRLED